MRARFRFAAALLASFWVAEAPAGEPAARITEIVVVREDVFSEAEAAYAFVPYGLANGLHTVTREAFVRRELLLAPGDELSPATLAEAERRLRATRLFRTVSVTAEGTRVVVRTGDNWTLKPRLALSNKGGVMTYQFGLEEENLFGSGRTLSFRYDRGTDRLSRSLTWIEPQLLRSRWTLTASAADLSDGQSVDLRLVRPFDALLTPRSALLSFRQAAYDTKVYAGGEEVSTWEKRERRFDAEGGLLLRAAGDRADRLVAFVSWEDVELRERTGPPPVPEARTFLWAGAGFQREERGWIVRRDHDQLGKDEDFNLAPVGRVDAALSPSILGATAAGRVRASGSVGTAAGTGFALVSASGETRVEGGLRNSLVSAAVRGWWPAGRLLVATRVGVRSSWRADPEYQIRLDGLNGVRGYRLYAVSGTGNATANVEVRTTLLPDVFRIVVVGAAAFADAGVSWGDPDGAWRLADVGVGLRFGLPRAGKNVLLRMDVARALHPDPLGRTGWLFSFSSGQAF